MSKSTPAVPNRVCANLTGSTPTSHLMALILQAGLNPVGQGEARCEAHSRNKSGGARVVRTTTRVTGQCNGRQLSTVFGTDWRNLCTPEHDCVVLAYSGPDRCCEPVLCVNVRRRIRREMAHREHEDSEIC